MSFPIPIPNLLPLPLPRTSPLRIFASASRLLRDALRHPFSLFIPSMLSLLGALLAGLCLTGVRPVAAASFVMKPDQGEVKIEWGSMARPAPLPPLTHAALLLPVSFPGISGKTLLMQFDLGHPQTVLYSGKWSELAKRLAISQTDGTLPTLAFKLGELEVQAREVEIIKRDSKPIDWASDAPEVIGTIGTDFIDARVVTMDFKGGKVQFGNTRAVLGDLKFTPFKFQGRRLLLPAVFEGKQIEVMYDSGSSAFAWLTSEDEFTRLATPGAAVQSYPIRSWDKMVTAFTAPTSAQVTIGTTSFPIGEISRIDGMGWMQKAAISMLGTGGMVGNKLFLERTLIIDMTKKEFALK